MAAANEVKHVKPPERISKFELNWLKEAFGFTEDYLRSIDGYADLEITDNPREVSQDNNNNNS